MEVLLAFVAFHNNFLQDPSSVKAIESLNVEATEVGLLRNWNWNKDTHEPSNSTPANSAGLEGDGEEKIYLRTKFDIEIEFDKKANHVLGIKFRQQGGRVLDSESKNSLLTTSEPSSSAPSLLQQQENLFRYRLFPDWETSYLWYDGRWPGNPKDSYMVEWDDIEAQYPDFFLFYSDWHGILENDFDIEFSKGGSPGSLMNKTQLVAWEVCGFFLACWLVFQPGVHSVSFEPFGGKYDISKENMDSKCEMFLRDKRLTLDINDD